MELNRQYEEKERRQCQRLEEATRELEQQDRTSVGSTSSCSHCRADSGTPTAQATRISSDSQLADTTRTSDTSEPTGATGEGSVRNRRRSEAITISSAERRNSAVSGLIPSLSSSGDLDGFRDTGPHQPASEEERLTKMSIAVSSADSQGTICALAARFALHT